MIFLHPVQLGLSEHPNSGVRMMEAGGVLRLKVDKIIVGEVGVICAAADTDTAAGRGCSLSSGSPLHPARQSASATWSA